MWNRIGRSCCLNWGVVGNSHVHIVQVVLFDEGKFVTVVKGAAGSPCHSIKAKGFLGVQPMVVAKATTPALERVHVQGRIACGNAAFCECAVSHIMDGNVGFVQVGGWLVVRDSRHKQGVKVAKYRDRVEIVSPNGPGVVDADPLALWLKEQAYVVGSKK